MVFFVSGARLYEGAVGWCTRSVSRWFVLRDVGRALDRDGQVRGVQAPVLRPIDDAPGETSRGNAVLVIGLACGRA